MSFQVLTGIPDGQDPRNDAINRGQLASCTRTDPKDEFKTVAVTVDGVKDTSGKAVKVDVTLRYPLDGWYIFACYSDNEPLQKLDRDMWNSLAGNAIEKFAAVKNKLVKDGPRVELHNRYNWFAELNSAIEYRPETVQFFSERAAQAKERDEIAAVRARLGI